jgi:hypothetical protein
VSGQGGNGLPGRQPASGITYAVTMTTMVPLTGIRVMSRPNDGKNDPRRVEGLGMTCAKPAPLLAKANAWAGSTSRSFYGHPLSLQACQVFVTPPVRDEGVSGYNTRNRDEYHRYAMAVSRRRLVTLKTASWRSGGSPVRGGSSAPGGNCLAL